MRVRIGQRALTISMLVSSCPIAARGAGSPASAVARASTQPGALRSAPIDGVEHPAAGVVTQGKASWRVGLHAGWWDTGVDISSPFGLMMGLSVPWVLYLPVFRNTGQDGIVALDMRIAYRHQLSVRTAMTAGLLGAWNYSWGDPCGIGCTEETHRLFFFPMAGIRHTWVGAARRNGPMIGLDLTLAVLQVHHDDSGWFRKGTNPLAGIAFSQIYVGYEW